MNRDDAVMSDWRQQALRLEAEVAKAVIGRSGRSASSPQPSSRADTSCCKAMSASARRRCCGPSRRYWAAISPASKGPST
jgi:hypothetical protein